MHYVPGTKFATINRDAESRKESDVFRRRLSLVRRPFLGRPRLLGAALIGGLGFAAGRASKPSLQAGSAAAPEIATKLRELSDLHAAGALSDEEFAAAKARLLAS